MGTLKIGPAEEKVIEEIEKFKVTYKPQLKSIQLGVKLIAQQLANNQAEEIQEIKNQISNVVEIVERLVCTVTQIYFSEERDEEKFSVEWFVYDEMKQYYRLGYYGRCENPITERQFLHAICSWEEEAYNRITLFRQIAGGDLCYNICSDMVQQIHKIVYEYVNSKET